MPTQTKPQFPKELVGDPSLLTKDQRKSLTLLRAALPLAVKLAAQSAAAPTFAPTKIAAEAAMQVVRSLLIAVQRKCPLAQPPAEVDQDYDATGNMILRCRHPSPHEWDGMGKRIK